MKRQLSLAAALCLGGLGLAQAQTTTNTNSTPATDTRTNSTYSTTPTQTPATTNTLSNGAVTNGTTTTNGSMTNGTANGNYNGTTTYGTTTPAVQDSYNTNARPNETKVDYKNFAYGIYAGLNTTKFDGESFDANGDAKGLTGRLGYQLGFFVRGGGRLYGQIGAEYFASSSNYFTSTTVTGQPVNNIQDQINIKYIQVPVYVGFKLVESDRGISSVRIQAGLEYANRIGSDANKFGSLNNFKLKSGTFNALGQIGFDAGPAFLDLTYHYGLSDSIDRVNAGFAGSQRRILSASLGFKF